MDELYALLNQIEDQVNAGVTRPLESYEVQQAFEVENYLVQNYSYNRPKAAAVSKVAATNPFIMNRLKPLISNGGMQGGTGRPMQLQGNLFTPVAAAQFDFVITRLTHSINEALPVALFGAQDLANGYRKMLAEYIPAGVTLSDVLYGEQDGVPNSVDFVYTAAGPVQDTVRVTVPQYAYPSFLQSCLTDMLNIEKTRYKLSDKTQVVQFGNVFDFKTASMFGRTTKNQVSVTAMQSPQQYQEGIIDIDGKFPIDKETGLIVAISDTGANNFGITLSMFISKFYRQNAAGF